ncbi:MAG: ribonuclease HII [Oceanospirillaceae bacterium]|nr:ribonuclease HII [Oceanospirillaceae bacterium]
MLDLEQYTTVEKLAGCDEVGRGPLVGDVVAAAVILDLSKPIAGLADSKKLTEKKRDYLYQCIMEKALCVSVGRASHLEIDQLNILHASMLAMQRSIEGLSVQPSMVLVDGNRCPNIEYPCEAIIKGDAKVAAISAASIVAKVIRDAEMKALHQQYPEYGFDRHKGYPTKEHMAALKQYGPLSMHRKSFKPVKVLLD